MNNKKAFTLVELLVVISIIALLLAVLMPALSKARELGRRTVCSSLQKSYALANMTYASVFDARFVPFSQPHSDLNPATGSPYTWDERWCENKAFRKYISVSARVEIQDGGWDDAFMFPQELRCASQQIRDPVAYSQKIFDDEGWRVVISFGYNVEQWRGNGRLTDDSTWWPSDKKYYGNSQASVKRPAQIMMFIDNNYYQARYERANPDLWDKYGEVLQGKINMGQTCYRHSGGAVIAFFDGHTGYLKSSEIFDKKNIPPRSNIRSRKPHPLWDIVTTDLKY